MVYVVIGAVEILDDNDDDEHMLHIYVTVVTAAEIFCDL